MPTLAIDGDMETIFSSRRRKDNWISVGLAQPADVASVVVYNRQDTNRRGWLRNLGSFDVWLGMTTNDRAVKCASVPARSIPRGSYDTEPYVAECEMALAVGAYKYATIAQTGTKRFLTLSEVYVMARPSAPSLPPQPNSPPAPSSPPPAPNTPPPPLYADWAKLEGVQPIFLSEKDDEASYLRACFDLCAAANGCVGILDEPASSSTGRHCRAQAVPPADATSSGFYRPAQGTFIRRTPASPAAFAPTLGSSFLDLFDEDEMDDAIDPILGAHPEGAPQWVLDLQVDLHLHSGTQPVAGVPLASTPEPLPYLGAGLGAGFLLGVLAVGAAFGLRRACTLSTKTTIALRRAKAVPIDAHGVTTTNAVTWGELNRALKACEKKGALSAESSKRSGVDASISTHSTDGLPTAASDQV